MTGLEWWDYRWLIAFVPTSIAYPAIYSSIPIYRSVRQKPYCLP